MYDQFKDYFESIGLTQEAFIARINLAFERLGQVVSEELGEVMIEDTVDEEGNRTYLHMAAVSDRYIAFAENFLHAETVYVAPLSLDQGNLRIATSAFDFKEATKDSRLEIHVLANNTTSWTLQVTGNNCEHVWRVFKTAIRPRLLKEA